MSCRCRATILVVVLAAAAALAMTPVAHAAPVPLGNAWHLPASLEGVGNATMRVPLRPSGPAAITIVSGNQYRGAGNAGNQTQAGSAVLYRAVGAATWSSAQLAFAVAAGNNKYYQASIPASALAAGDTLEYYLRIAYSDRATTYVHGDDDGSRTTGDEAIAQGAPFAIAIPARLEPSGPTLSVPRGPVEARVTLASGHVSIVGPSRNGSVAAIHLAPPQARVDGRWLAVGRVVSTSRRADGVELRQAMGRRVVTSRLTTTAEGVFRYQVIDWGGSAPTLTSLDGASPGDEHFYGFGEKFNSLDQAGKRVRVLTADAPGDKGDRSYKVAPWFVSTRGYGFHLDSTVESSFDLRQAMPDRWSMSHLHGALAYHVVYGPELTTVLSRYTGIVGRPAAPPDWVLAPWISSDHWRDGGEVRYVVTKMIERGIPASVFVFDSPWEVSYNDFTWNMTQFGRGGVYEGQRYDGFSSVTEMMAFLRSHGLYVVVWMTPFLNVESYDEGVPGQNLGRSALYDEAARAGYLVRSSPGGPPLVVTWWKGRGTAVDFTNPAARAWFQGKLRALVAESGGAIAGFKIDDGEADFIPLHASYADGRTGAEMRNGYTVEYHRAVGAVLGDQGVLFSRSGYTGTSAFPAGWAGDNEPNFGAGNGLPSVIVAGQSAAMSGYAFWAHDIGGYQDSNLSRTPANLFMRWTQFGALSPIMQMHRQVRLGLQYPWSYGDEALGNYRRYAELHTALAPYLATYAAQAAETGLPILRPLVLAYPDDPNVHGVNHTYLLGDDLLVAPVISNDAVERRLYLPAGGWVDFWTGERIAGGRVVTWQSADQTRLPLYVREGAVLPMLPGDVQSLAPAAYVRNPDIATPGGDLELRVYPPAAGAAPSERRFADGTRVRVERVGGQVVVDVDGPARRLQLRVVGQVGGVIDRVHPGGLTRLVVDAAAAPRRREVATAPASEAGGCAAGGSGAGLVLILGAVTIGCRRRRRR